MRLRQLSADDIDRSLSMNEAIEEGYLKEDDLTEIGQVILGSAAGRSSDEEITFFKSVGIAVQDAAVCHAALRQAESLGLGSSIEL